MLTDVRDEEVLQLPDIHAQAKRREDKFKPGPNCHNNGSTSFQPTDVAVDVKIMSSRKRDGIPSAIPQRKPGVTLKATSSGNAIKGANAAVVGGQARNSITVNETKASSVQLLSVPKSGPKLLSGRRSPSPTRLRDGQASENLGHNQTQLHTLGAQLLPPEKTRPYRKAFSQREFSMEEKENGLPNILTTETRHGTQQRLSAGMGMSRSSSAITFVLPPISANNGICGSAASMSKSCSDSGLADKTAATKSERSSLVVEDSSCASMLTRRLRVRGLWRTAVDRLALLRHSDEERGSDDKSWTLSPSGDVLRPVYVRWAQRRDALAEPERMCMPQVLREQIQRDVSSRKRSVKRSVSKFFNVKLGLNLEEDLSA